MMECIRGSGFGNEDIQMLIDSLKLGQRDRSIFLDWFLRAEDAVKVLRKNRELVKIKRLEEMSEVDERIQ